MRRTILSLVDSRVKELYLSFMLLQDDMKIVPAPRTKLYLSVPEQHKVFSILESRFSTNKSEYSKCTEGYCEEEEEEEEESEQENRTKNYLCESRLSRCSDAERVYTFVVDVCDNILQTFMPVNWSNNYTNFTPIRSKFAENKLEGSMMMSNTSKLLEFESAKRRYRTIIQTAFYANSLLTPQSQSWKRALAAARYELTQLHITLHVKKYRALYKRYGWVSQLSSDDLIDAYQNNANAVASAITGLENRYDYGYDDENDNKKNERKQL